MASNEYKEKKKWPESSGVPLESVLFLDLKNNRYTPMPLKRNNACFVCGKNGTTKTSARRTDLHVSDLRITKLVSAVRKATNFREEPLILFSETSKGERKLEKGRDERLSLGDYIRVIVEDVKEASNESILKLT